MSDADQLRAAVAAGALGGEAARHALLRSIADVARAIFGARASSIMTHEPEARELEFAAVSGEGFDLLGSRFPDSKGVAGWVFTARQPLVLEDVEADPRFARDIADSTGYVPKGLMAAPLLLEERALGVLSVLDRPERASFSLSEMDLLGLFAHQAAIAIDISAAARRASAVLERADPELEDLAALAERIGKQSGPARERGVELIASLRKLLDSMQR